MPPTPQLLKNLNILLVDDDEGILQMTNLWLTTLGARVVTTNDGEKALDLYTLKSNDFDVVLLDYMIPGTWGADVYDFMRNFDKELPIIFMTGFPVESVLKERLEHEFTGLLKKPCKSSVLIDEILRYVPNFNEQVSSTEPITASILNEEPELASLVITFASNILKRFNLIETAVNDELWDEARTLLHKLAGGGSVGYCQLTKTAVTLEDYIRENLSSDSCLLLELQSVCNRIYSGVGIMKDLYSEE